MNVWTVMADAKARAVIQSEVITAGVLTVVNSEMMGNPAKVSAYSHPLSLCHGSKII